MEDLFSSTWVSWLLSLEIAAHLRVILGNEIISIGVELTYKILAISVDEIHDNIPAWGAIGFIGLRLLFLCLLLQVEV